MSVAGFPLRDGRPAVVSLRPDSTSVAVDEEQVSSYDLLGRPYVLVRDGWTWRRSLDGRLLQKGPGADGAARLRRRLAADEGAAVVEAARRDVSQVLQTVEGDRSILPRDVRAEAVVRLQRIASMDAAALAADASLFAATYRPVGILPPDQYLAVVLQATEGCSWNGCTFCGFFKDVRFHAKSPAEFAGHVAAVRGYFGASLALRKSVFLGEANALCASHERVLGWLEDASRVFPTAATGGIHAFVDAWTGARKTVDEWRTYRALGLRRVYVGLETADPELRAFVEKPGSATATEALVAALHEAGIAVGVIVMIGLGGERFFDAHVRETGASLARMRLRQGDFLYLSDFLIHAGLEYERRGRTADLRALGPARCADQRRALLAPLRFENPARPPRVATYDIREFVY
ncbi:MAG: radical SAM protein [Acidobacteria bacterium]|nr:radical SAM protein [Acidobacteriota bacterium]